MSEQNETVAEKVIKVGPDRVTIREKEVIIEARTRMPDWEVRELNPLPVYFNDQKYTLVEARKADSPYAVCYVLLPWPEGLTSNAKGLLTYDTESVSDRDTARRSGQLEEVAHAFMMPFYPFLGLLWSGTQRRLSRFGFVPHTISGISIFLVFCGLFAQGVFAIVTINGSARSGKMMIGGFLRALSSQDNLHLGPVSIPIVILDGLLAVALLSDVAMRYTYYLREHDWSGGFLEWLMPRSLKSKSDPAS
jgi:hypothetical protein